MPDTLSLQGKVAMVTGSGRENGIGAGIALALARNGASVAVHHVSDSVKERAAHLCEALKEAGGQAIVLQGPVDTLAGARQLVSKTLEGFNTDHIDILVNNAGIACLCPITEVPNEHELSHLLHVNILGPFYMVNSVLPHMPRGGRIINISSTNAKRGNINVSTYAASKAALDNLTWTWADELGKSRGITVNSIAPGPVPTDLYPKGRERELMEVEVALTRAEDRAGTKEDIGDAVLLLVSEKSRWITGQYISNSEPVQRQKTISIVVNRPNMASPAWDVEPLEIFDARQSLRIGAYDLAEAAIRRLPESLAAADDAILIQLEICNAKGDYLTMKKYVSQLLSQDVARPPAVMELLQLCLTRCRMMTEMAMSDYIASGVDTWDRFLKDVNLESCDKTTLFLEAEFHRGMHACIHFIYNNKKASQRPRDTDFGTETLEDYPLPLLRQDAAVRLTTVVRRLLNYNDPHAALGIYTVLVGWYSLDEVDSGKLLEEILNHGIPDSLLAARIYIQHATATAKRGTFEIARTLLTEAKSAVAFLGPSEYTNEIRMIEAKMGFIAIGSLGALSGPLGSAVIEGEYVSMVQEFLLAGHYSLAANAVTEYMACIDYIPQPERVNEILDLTETLGATSGNNAYMWTVRLIALGSAPLQGQIALGHRSIWCQTYLSNYSETGAWEISRRFALHYSLYYHKIGDLNQQLCWAMAAADYDARITNDPYERLSSMHQTFMIMIRRLNLLPEEEHEGFELEDVQQYGIDAFEACEAAGFKDLASSFLERLSQVGIVPETLLGASQDNLAPVLTPLGEPKNLDANELLTLYVKQRNLLDRCLDYNCAEQAFEVIDQFNAYIDPILDVLRHGTDLNLRAGDFAMVRNAMLVRLARGILRVDRSVREERGLGHAA
ncbi:hypothetical protein NLG97_g9465 [Lecanicillium saksenae]|uniref:Uncharacterized protein n=1 Tax=Lecanicillium saksenae TaxID=468837 RepID=A0ACC1QJB1_9HYPO|nr:hypothetical protein NLG97_g9465 [Lecanicillium saksenae]